MNKWISMLFLVAAFSSPVHADSEKFFDVTVTNLTRGQSFTPILIATHRSGVNLFELGQPASPELAAIAEGGNTAPMTAKLQATPGVSEVVTTSGLLAPGQSVTMRVRARSTDQLSMASMLIPTNDGFFALNDVPLPRFNFALEYESAAYDAGTEPNDELCANIPGPVCGGEGGSPLADGEGYVHVHAGIHGIGNLVAADRDWRNPVARIIVKKAR